MVAKKTAKKSAKKTAKKTARKTAKKKTAGKVGKKAGKKAAKAKASSLEVNMGHVFALRPRVNTSFKAGDFHAAKYQLQDEPYSDISEATKAVAEKALELTHGGSKKTGNRRF